jgi:hypothetical protein
LCRPACASAQAGEGQGELDAPFAAHKIIGNVYFVGASSLAHSSSQRPPAVLINSDCETIPVIKASMEKLAFKFSDIRFC